MQQIIFGLLTLAPEGRKADAVKNIQRLKPPNLGRFFYENF